jgi:hypothetical protein
VTIIQGYQVPDKVNGTNAVRCVYLTNNATLAGFMLRNGATAPFFAPANLPAALGGGAFCNDISSVISNCVISGNSSGNGGGGANGGTLNNCFLVANSSFDGGGADNSTLNNCLVISNSAVEAGGGAFACTLNNCLVINNAATNADGFGGGSFGGILNDCTFANNAAANGGGVCNGTLNNCIVYYNYGSNYASSYSPVNLNYCCTTPLPDGNGDITNAPLLVNVTNDFHLQSNSPCIDSGNPAFFFGSTDLDGNPRVVGGAVDIGAYEYQTPASTIPSAWLKQYGLPTDGSADFVDSDGDGMNNWQEWMAGTNPTNAASLLSVNFPAASNPNGITVTWQSVNTRIYYLQSSTNLPVFTTIQSNILGQAGSTSYTDVTATNGGAYFYRVGVW